MSEPLSVLRLEVRAAASSPAAPVVSIVFPDGPMHVVLTKVGRTELPAETDRPSDPDSLYIVVDSGGTGLKSSSRSIDFGDGVTVAWMPQRLLVCGAAELPSALVAAAGEFTLYERELRRLEQAVRELEPMALDDVTRSHQLRWRDRAHWPRLRLTAETTSRLRLKYARLEAHWEKGGAHLGAEGRRLVTKLFRRAEVPVRAAALSERLEALEDLYEGASDRIAEYRWFLSGTALEIAIVILLAAEAALVVCDIYLRSRPAQ